MNYSLLTYSQLLSELESIRQENLNTLDKNAEYFEASVEIIRDSDIAYLSDMFDRCRFLFNVAEVLLNDTMHELNKKDVNLEPKPNVTYSLIERVSSFGKEADNQFFNVKKQTDKGDLRKIKELGDQLERWYELIVDNLFSLSHLETIAQTLNNNFRFIEPLSDVKVDNIFVQRNGITITKGEEIYINDMPVKLEGQRKKIMMILSHHYITNPGLPLSWIDIEKEIRMSTELQRDEVVNRVSSLRTRLKELGFTDLIEINNTLIGDDTAWNLNKL